MNDVIIYHEPDCGTSPKTLPMIRNAGTVVDTRKIPRAGITTLLTGAFGFAIYLLPALVPGVTEASLHVACGTAIVIFVGGVWQWGKRRQPARNI